MSFLFTLFPSEHELLKGEDLIVFIHPCTLFPEWLTTGKERAKICGLSTRMYESLQTTLFHSMLLPVCVHM